MEVSIKYQLITTLFSVCMGFVIGMIYEIFKIFRILSGLEFSNKLQSRIETIKLPIIKGLKIKNGKLGKIKRKILYFIWDLLFFIVITPIMQIFIYATSSGVVRWYIILGSFLGFLIYYITISKIISKLYEYVLLIVKIIFAYIMYFFKLPFNKLIFVMNNKVIKLKKKRKMKKALYKKEEIQNRKNIIISTGKLN